MKLTHGSRGELTKEQAMGVLKEWIAAELNCDPERIEITAMGSWGVEYFCHDGRTTETRDDAWKGDDDDDQG